MKRIATFLIAVAIVGSLALVEPVAAQSPNESTIEMAIDATDLPRKLLSAKLTIPVDPAALSENGELSLWYPKWVPGTHGPGGPIANVAGMKISDPSGERLEWHRGVGEFYRMTVNVPKGTTTVQVDIRYITNQPTTSSMGIDSFGSVLLGFVSAGTVMLYPDGVDIDPVSYTHLTLPTICSV